MKKAYIIHDAFLQGDEGTRKTKEFGRYLPGFNLEAYPFDPLGDMRSQVIRAVDVAIAGRYDLVLLDVYFGITGDDSARLGIDVALPRLEEHHIPVIVISSLSNRSQADDNSVEVQSASNTRYLPESKIKSLKEVAAALLSTQDHHANLGFGFKYRTAQEIVARKKVEVVFDNLSTACGSQPLEVPLAAPVTNFLGKAPRPLAEKDSHRLFTSVTTDGKAMAIRYEGTALTAKFVAAQLKQKSALTSFDYHYFQEMVRVEVSEDLDKRHFRSFYQAGFECFTVDQTQHLRNVARVCQLTSSLFDHLGLPLVLRLSHVHLMERVLAMVEQHSSVSPSLRSTLRRRIIGGLEKERDEKPFRDLLQVFQVSDEDVDLLVQMFRLRGKSLGAGIGFLEENKPVFGDLSAVFALLLQFLKQAGIEACCQFDPGIYRSLSFYSGFTMQGDVMESEKSAAAPECLGGGDFTGLVESFGVTGPVYSVGMAVGVDRIISILPQYHQQ